MFLPSVLLSFTALAIAAPSASERRANLVPKINPSTIPLSGTSGQGGAYPRLASLADGSLLGTYTATVTGGDKQLVVTKSTDGGKSFFQLGSIATQPGDLDNAFLLQLSDGTVVGSARNHDNDYYRITAYKSTNQGKDWVWLSDVEVRKKAAPGAPLNGLWEPFFRQAHDGSLQIYYAAENSDVDQDILMRTSYDGGATWSGTTTVAGATTTGRDGMPGCSDFNDGSGTKLMCVFETTEGLGRMNVKSVVSTDDGKNWGYRSQVYASAEGTHGAVAAPQLVTTTGGALVASVMTNEDNGSSTEVFKILTSPPTVSGSWGNKATVMTGAWPGLFALTDGTVMGCAGNAECHSISFS
ncbi:glycoside hydrolase family 93 protein [Cylindrobasidium torrendii FP15055 ss-10]|uniref:Glycoside hydrolase family 93 protein n=1 Tax=Cylindrobasidium torrendii FP15055 ss-10 TaxID=1314674 RepID=A0A0D7AYC1_9AGAR|nr:glycoside hydrolase family 93 protein [Cylindrobasidium torrendii FP15055 ss-10]